MKTTVVVYAAAVGALTVNAGCQSSRHLSQPIAAQKYAMTSPGVLDIDDERTRTEPEQAQITGERTHHITSTASALAEAEALYANGVMANIDQRWHDAQVAFEQAIAILGDIESLEGTDTAAVTQLLREITGDYEETLIALGVLDNDASSSAVILRYQDDKLLEHESIEAPAEPEPVAYDFPIELNDKVRNCIVYYQTVAREPLEKFLQRAGQYLPMMKEIIASYGIPTDLAYLPLVESGFNNKAYSYAHAAGPWQFIASTGRLYGLQRNWWFDERRDFEKSTHAACRYLKDLYEMFGDWKLALAAYNGGEGRVGRQIKRQNTRDFWKLRLHKQTRNYVPLFMASLLIAKDPETYGFYVESDPPMAYDWAATNKALELKDVARALGCSMETLVELNPELRREVTPPDVKPYRLRVPQGTSDKFADAYKSLPASSRTEWVRHTVRRGETLSLISRRYGVSVSEIVSTNKLRSRHRISVGQTLTIPVPLAYASSRASAPAPRASTSKPAPSGGRYTVKRGDSLWKLAKKFGTTTSAIRRANNMGAHSKLIAGDTITIPGRGQSSASSFLYTIRNGDTIERIARKFGVTIRQILGANSLSNPNRIFVGQRIRIPQGL